MNSIEYLKSNLTNFYGKHSDIEVKYEFRESINTHIIQIKSEDSFRQDKLVMDDQIKLEDEFELVYPSENILFITDNELVSIDSPLLELGTLLGCSVRT